MSKKLLSEAQVRRFQSLASITPLQEMGSPMMDEDYLEGEYAEGHGAGHREAAHSEEMEDAHAEGLYEEEDMEAEDQESDVELEEDLVERFMDAAKTIEEMAQALGGGAMDMGGDDDLDVKMDDDAPEAPPMDDAPEGDAPEDEEEKDILELALEGVNYQPSQKEIVSEVAKRVAKRIMEAKQAQAKLNRALGNK